MTPRVLPALCLVVVVACGGGGSPGAVPLESTSTLAAAPETVRVPLPPRESISARAPLWTRRLDGVALPDGRLWSAYAPSGMAVSADRLAIADGANHELLALDTLGRVVALAGGLGQGGDDLYAPGDAAALDGGRLVVADRGNARLVALTTNADGGQSRLALPGPPVRLAAARGALYALTLVPAQSPRLLRITGCCEGALVDTLALSPPVRAVPSGMAVLDDGRVALLSPTGELGLYGADGTLTRYVKFVRAPADARDAGDALGEPRQISTPGGGAVPMPTVRAAPDTAARTVVAIAATGGGRNSLLVSFGDVVACFDLDTSSLTEPWEPPLDPGGRALSTVSLVATGGSDVYTYQPASHTLARFRGGC